MRSFKTSALLLGLLASGSTACTIGMHGEGVVSREEKRFTVSGDLDLNLRTFDGSIQVKSWDQKDVRVEIERRSFDAKAAADLVVNATQTGNKIVIDAPNPRRGEGLFVGPSSSVSLVVTVPRKLTLEARTGDGSIAVDDVAGSIVLHTGDGAIRVTHLTGELKAHSGDGSIRIDEIAGKVEVDTGDGSIDLAGRLDAVSIKTGDGSVRIKAADGSAVASDWSISTGDGSIDLRLPAALDADLDAHTNDGQVRTTGFDIVNGGRHDDRNTVRGPLGKGGRALRVRSGDGSILISR